MNQANKKFDALDHKVSVKFCSTSMIGATFVAMIVVLAVALSGCGGSSPTEPVPTPTPTPPATLAISPTTLTNWPGQGKTFYATGGNGSYVWTATGGTLASTTGPSSFYLSGNTPGTFEVRVKSGAEEAVASVTILSAAGNTLTFISADPPSGSVLKVGDHVTVTVSFTALQSGAISIRLDGINGGGSNGAGPTIPAGTGTVQPWVTSDTKGTSTIVRVDLVGSNFLPITHIDIPLTYTWQ